MELPDKVYFRIGEVAELLGVKPHVIRFWQQQFPTVKPERSRSGRFLYPRPTVERLDRVRRLLYEEGYTIVGARKALRGAEPEAVVDPDALAEAAEAAEVARAAAALQAAHVAEVAALTTSRDGALRRVAALEAAVATARREAVDLLALLAPRDDDNAAAASKLRGPASGD